MNETWKPYLRNKLIRYVNDIAIIVPNDYTQSIPIACPVCTTLYRTIDDEDSHNKFQCCEACASRWAYVNQKDWLNGWRPSQDQIIEDIKNRTKLLIECSFE